MRCRLGANWLSVLSLATVLACKPERHRAAPEPSKTQPTSVTTENPRRALAPPISSEVVALEKSLQASRLRLPPRTAHLPRLAFAAGMLATLGANELQLFDLAQQRLALTEPLDNPLAVLTLADGSLLAAGARACLRWERGWKHARALPGLVLLPGAELYADAQQPDVVWVFERGRLRSPARLSSFRLAPGSLPVLLPEQTIELGAADEALLGVTREGVWLYLTSDHIERLGPGGARLSAVRFARSPLPSWALPTVRLDQSVWIEPGGVMKLVQLTPRFAERARTTVAGAPFAADVGDQGRLLAVVAITGDGPRFELQLFDAGLRPRARVALPAEAPTGADDWVQVVSQNQQLAVSPAEPRVAVGGPARMTIFDGAGKVLFSIPSR
jgi:hypothetical protein